MLTISFYEVPARDKQRQRTYKIVTHVPYPWRRSDWFAYRVPKARHRWQSWDSSVDVLPTDDIVREARKRRRVS